MTGQSLWTVAGSALAIAALSALADRGRVRRRNLDQAGWVPWTLIQVISMIAAAVATGLALKG